MLLQNSVTEKRKGIRNPGSMFTHCHMNIKCTKSTADFKKMPVEA